MLAARSRSSIAILASPYSADSSAMSLIESSVYLPGYRASSARDEAISVSSSSEYLSKRTVFVLRKVEWEASSRYLSTGSCVIMMRDIWALASALERISW